MAGTDMTRIQRSVAGNKAVVIGVLNGRIGFVCSITDHSLLISQGQ
jgi:hypothetical protein